MMRMTGRFSRKALGWLVAGVCVCATAPLASADNGVPPIISLSSGVGVSSPAAPAAAAPGMLDLLQQVRDLKHRIESLQNQVEIQNHELQQLRSEQRHFFSDVDTRLGALQSATSAAAANTAPAASAPPTTPAPTATPAPQASDSGSSGSGAQQYQHAFSLLRASHYHAAIAAFETFLKQHPSSPNAGSAHYWTAETYYVLGEYRQALPQFRAVVAGYPHSDKLPDSLYKIGYIENRLGLPARARVTWNELIRKYPHSAPASLARRHLHSLGG